MPGAGTSRSAAGVSHLVTGPSRPAASHTEEESESPIGLPQTGTTTQPSTSVVPADGTTAQVSTSVSTTVPAVSGAPLGAAATTTQPSQLQFPSFTPAVPTTPWLDPMGLGTANLISDEVNRIVSPLKREIESLKSKIEKLGK